MPEKPAFDFGQRQHGEDLAGSLGIEKIGSVSLLALNQILPRRQMKERRLGAGPHKIIPARTVSGIEYPYDNRGIQFAMHFNV